MESYSSSTIYPPNMCVHACVRWCVHGCVCVCVFRRYCGAIALGSEQATFWWTVYNNCKRIITTIWFVSSVLCVYSNTLSVSPVITRTLHLHFSGIPASIPAQTTLYSTQDALNLSYVYVELGNYWLTPGQGNTYICTLHLYKHEHTYVHICMNITHTHTHNITHTHTHIYIYIYIYRKRERERERENTGSV